MIRGPPRSTRTEHTLSLHDALPFLHGGRCPLETPPVFRALYDWTMRQAARPNAGRVLAVVSFLESSVFPIPPDVMLIPMRSEEHTSELQSLMRISYAVFCLKKKNKCTP